MAYDPTQLESYKTTDPLFYASASYNPTAGLAGYLQATGKYPSLEGLNAATQEAGMGDSYSQNLPQDSHMRSYFAQRDQQIIQALQQKAIAQKNAGTTFGAVPISAEDQAAAANSGKGNTNSAPAAVGQTLTPADMAARGWTTDPNTGQSIDSTGKYTSTYDPTWNNAPPLGTNTSSSGTPSSVTGNPAATPPLPANPFSSTLNIGSTGSDVANLQKILNAQGANLTVDGQYGPKTQAAVKAYQQANGLTADGIFGPLTSAKLTGGINAVGNPANQPASTLPTPYGTVNPNANVDLTSGTSPTFDSSSIGNLSTSDVLNSNMSQADQINAYLKQQADAYAALNQTKVQALQGQADIMYGRNGAGAADASLQGVEQAQFDRQMAFKTVPAEIAYNSAQMALSLYKQTPAYLTETQARDTAFNMLQTYPDINYAYNPNMTAQQNLQAIKEALPSSAKYQATLINYKGYYDPSGMFHMYNAKSTAGTPVQGGAGAIVGSGESTINPSPQTPAPTRSNPVTPVGTYLGNGGPISTPNISSPINSSSNSIQVAFWKDWTSGGVADARSNLNTAIGHLFEADELFPQIGNGGNTISNSVSNFISSAFNANSPKAGALSGFKTAQTKASNELTAAYGGDTGTERTLAASESGTSSSQTQWTSFLDTSTKLLASKLGSQADTYRQTFGHYPPSLDALISPINQVKLAAFTKTNLNGIVNGVPVSPSTQALMNTAQIVKGVIYLPDAHGNYQPQQ